ncbi:MAG: hypothetical protein WDW36_009737 [Sanguina aurantia]
MPLAAITDAPVASWSEEEVTSGYSSVGQYAPSSYEVAFSKYNPSPGTGRTGHMRVAPNNYPFYSDTARYTPLVQSDGGQLSEWKPMYAPSKELAEEHRAAAYASGVPHGYVAPGDTYKDAEMLQMRVVSLLHSDSEYGAEVDPATGRHHGGPFSIMVSPQMRVEELRLIIRDAGGIIPALQKLSYAGKNLEDSQRTLEHYGITYWHAKFPHWPLKVRRVAHQARRQHHHACSLLQLTLFRRLMPVAPAHPDPMPEAAAHLPERRASLLSSLTEGLDNCARRLRSRRASLSTLTALMHPLPLASLLPRNTSSSPRRPLPTLQPLSDQHLLSSAPSGDRHQSPYSERCNADSSMLEPCSLAAQPRSHSFSSRPAPLSAAKEVLPAFIPFSSLKTSCRRSSLPLSDAAGCESPSTQTISWSPFATLHPHFSDGSRGRSLLVPVSLQGSIPEEPSPTTSSKRTSSVSSMQHGTACSPVVGQPAAGFQPTLCRSDSSCSLPRIHEPLHVARPPAARVGPVQPNSAQPHCTNTLYVPSTQLAPPTGNLTSRSSLSPSWIGHGSPPAQLMCIIWNEARLHAQNGYTRSSSSSSSSSASFVSQTESVQPKKKSPICPGLRSTSSKSLQPSLHGERPSGLQGSLVQGKCGSRSASHHVGLDAVVPA